MIKDELIGYYSQREEEPIAFAEYIEKIIKNENLTYNEICRAINIKISKATTISRYHQLTFLPTEFQELIQNKHYGFSKFAPFYTLGVYKEWRLHPTDENKEIYFNKVRELWVKGQHMNSREFVNYVSKSNNGYNKNILNTQKEPLVNKQKVVKSIDIKNEIDRIRKKMKFRFSWDDTLTTHGNAKRFLELLKINVSLHELQYSDKARLNNVKLRYNWRKKFLREWPQDAKFCVCGCKFQLDKVRSLLAKDEKELQNEKNVEEKNGDRRDSITDELSSFVRLLQSYKNGIGETT